MQSLSQQELDRGKAERINQKVKFILQQVNDGDQLVVQGKPEQAKKLYIACAEAMNKLVHETKDDPNFQAAIKDNVAKIIQKAERCSTPG